MTIDSYDKHFWKETKSILDNSESKIWDLVKLLRCEAKRSYDLGYQTAMIKEKL